MRFLLATATLATTFALAQGAARADEPLEVATPAHEDATLFVQGFGEGVLVSNVAPMAGVEVGVRVHPSLELELDYAYLMDPGPDAVGFLGAGLRWLAVNNDFATYLYAGVGLPTVGATPIIEAPVFRTGIGSEWTARNGVFVSGQVGVDVVAIDDEAYPLLEGRVGVGVRF